MRVLICPDKFAGTLSAPDVAAAVARGWRSVAPDDTLDCRPMADGGPGFLAAIEAGVRGERLPVVSTDPLGRPVTAEILVAGTVAYVESAAVCGLDLVAPDERNPRITSSYGLGALVLAARHAGATEIVIGLGGSAVNDGGAGLLEALGVTAVDDAGHPLPRGGAALAGCAAIIGSPVVRGTRLIAASDVDSPLTGIFGASAVFGPQKGATREDVLVLDAALGRYAAVLSDQLPGCPPDLAARPGAGAAGGLGAAILALGGSMRSGIGLVAQFVGLSEALDRADVVVTGEGSLDAQSLRGKVVSGVARAARDRGLPCVVVAGRSSAGRRDAAAAGITDTYTLVDYFGDEARAMADAAGGLAALGARLAGQWSPAYHSRTGQTA